MILRTIYEKAVDRPIEGVIKADDEAALRQEVEEYVLTNELEKGLEAFLDAYNNYTGANGAWISGFFGSGKSHLLKILALVMENREVEGVKVSELFLPKCGENGLLRAALKKAISIPSKSILFNIDQKADVISKSQTDALLAVFVKVFDESCGYYGKQPYIAQFERELDQDRLLGKFRDAFQRISSHDWEWGRMRAKRAASFIDAAYREVTGQDVSGIMDKYRTDYRVSIEDFAEQVHTCIEAQEKDFRLNFFVDEVGQYVADNIRLMTNLQTVAESLASKSRGRAWIIVTAQEDMDTVVGEMGKQQGNDFSKIQARFANRLKLTSKDVDEVIRKRLLLKNEAGTGMLCQLYENQKNSFRTLFDFADGSQLYRNFQDQDHFVQSYPFIPYQIPLFQTAIQNLSLHNAFEGKHRSVGERSMLGVFQQVAVGISEEGIGTLATFDLMFEGIRTALKARIQRSVQLAEQHLENPFAVKVLKALFLVKYIREFTASRRNLTVLMLDAFGKDMEQTDAELREALELLEQQIYIRRNGEYYEFLTDEEKDIEEEIRNTDMDAKDVADHVQKMIFDRILEQKKIRYGENKQDYPFSRKMDEILYGRQYELTLHIITPFHESAGNETLLAMQSAGRDELLVILPPDERMVRDFLDYERTEKYTRQNISLRQQDTVRRILTDKKSQNENRIRDLEQHVRTLLGRSRMIISGSAVETGTEEPRARIIKGFHELIARTYPNLKMLPGFTYTEEYIAICLKENRDTLFGNDPSLPGEAEQEMLAFIKAGKNTGVRTTVKSLVERFERKSYGWYYAAVLCILAKLCAAGNAELSTDSNIVEEDQLEKALRNSHGHANLLITPLSDFTPSQFRNLKEFYEQFFDAPPSAKEAGSLGRETAAAFAVLAEKLSALASEKSAYPFLRVMDAVLEKLRPFQGKSYTYYLTELNRAEEELLDIKENIIEPMQGFMNGPLRKIYDEAAAFLKKQEHNFSEIADDDSGQILAILQDEGCYKGRQMQQVKSMLDTLSAKIGEKLTQTRKEAGERIRNLLEQIRGREDFARLDAQKQEELKKPFEDCIQSIGEQSIIALIRDKLRGFEEKEYPIILSEISAPDNTEAEPRKTSDFGISPLTGGKNKVAETGHIPLTSLRVSFDKDILADEDDIESYLDVLREAMKKEISEGKRIQV